MTALEGNQRKGRKLAMKAVEALKMAETESGIVAVLMDCEKASDMVRAYEVLTGREYAGRTVAIRRTDLALNIADEIMHVRGEEKFIALSVSEKYEYLKCATNYEQNVKTPLCTKAELEEIAHKLGVKSESEGKLTLQSRVMDGLKVSKLKALLARDAGMMEIYSVLLEMSREALSEMALSAGIRSESNVVDCLMEHFKAERASRIFKSVKEAESPEKAREILKGIDTLMLERVGELAGADFHERCEEVKAKEVSKEELIDWAISWVLDRLGKETPLIVKMMGVRNVKNAYTYIRGMRTIKMMLLGNVLAEDVKESLPKLGLDELKGMSAGFGKPVDFDCEDDEMAEGLRNLVAGEIFYLRVGKKKIVDYLSEDEKEMYADYLAGNPRLAGRSW